MPKPPHEPPHASAGTPSGADERPRRQPHPVTSPLGPAPPAGPGHRPALLRRRVGRRAVALLAAGAAFAALVSGCATPIAEGNARGGNTYTIGVLAPETGARAEDGEIVRAGVELAIADVRRSGILGKDDLRAAYADHQAMPAVAVSAFNQMVSLRGPLAVVCTFSGPTLAITPIATRQHVTLLNPGGVTIDLDQASPYLINLLPLIDTQAKLTLRYAKERRLGKRVALLYSNDALGQETNGVFAQLVQQAGLDYVGSVAFDPASPDFRAALSKVQSFKPDMVYETGSASQSGNIIKQAADMGFTPRWMGYSALAHKETVTIGGKAAEGALFTIPAITDPKTGEYYPEYRAYQAAMRKTGHDESDYLTQTSYESVRLVAAAIARTKKLGEPVTRDSVSRHLKDLKGFRSLFGPAEITAEGKVEQAQTVQQVEHGKFVVKRTYTSDDLAELE